MKGASLKELKAELSTLREEQLLDLCMHLAKYKKENKELLTYLLFEAADENSYINSVKTVIDEQFESLNKTSIFLARKTLRKALRTTLKFIKFSGSKQTEVELLIYYCKKIKDSGISLNPNKAHGKMYLRQIQKINKVISTLHEDLQYDYSVEMEPLL